jgi:hypothetical protein
MPRKIENLTYETTDAGHDIITAGCNSENDLMINGK